MKIKTDFWQPPIPIRKFDWSAIDSSTYEAGEPIGHGETEAEAILDLVEQSLEKMVARQLAYEKTGGG